VPAHQDRFIPCELCRIIFKKGTITDQEESFEGAELGGETYVVPEPTGAQRKFSIDLR
jgi:G:T/U-mismatch repair DNA glycosylase